MLLAAVHIWKRIGRLDRVSSIAGIVAQKNAGVQQGTISPTSTAQFFAANADHILIVIWNDTCILCPAISTTQREGKKTGNMRVSLQFLTVVRK
jgi:hypothetical protein